MIKKFQDKVLERLKKQKVEVALKDALVDADFASIGTGIGKKTFTTRGGKSIESDVQSMLTFTDVMMIVVVCVGGRACSAYVDRSWLDEKNQVKVDAQLQVEGHPNIFAMYVNCTLLMYTHFVIEVM